MPEPIAFQLNGKSVRVDADGERPLLWILRTDLALTGTKFACGEGHCGACTVLVDGTAVRSCSWKLKDVRNREVITIEGLARDGKLHPLQQAFMDHDALQCGFCTPGMILGAYSLLRSVPKPSREQIIRRMDSYLCRCGAHTRIIDAIQSAAEKMKGGFVP